LRVTGADVAPGAQFLVCLRQSDGVWRGKQDRILIPLEQQTHSGKPFRSKSFTVAASARAIRARSNLQYAAPNLDLPLGNITWRVSLSDNGRSKNGRGSLSTAQEDLRTVPSAIDLQNYLQSEVTQQRERTKEAESFWRRQARPSKKASPTGTGALSGGFWLSGSDAAFNEDARRALQPISNFNSFGSG